MKWGLWWVLGTLSTVQAGVFDQIDVGGAPAWHFETETHGDGSRSLHLVFQTVAGVDYRVESSPDLVTWSEAPEDHWYGLGNEIVVPMVQVLAPPVPPDPPAGDPPPPVIFASLLMRPATGGGVLLSWRSLDDEGPLVHHFLLLTPDPAWLGTPLYAQTHGEHSFFIFNPGSAADPPAQAAIFGIKDAAMLADFEAGFADMNQAVHDAVIRTRNSPPPAPPSGDSRKFWRIWADWGLDTDIDGSFDYAEFAMAANSPQGSPNAMADAMNADANDNGIVDGEEQDGDQDGVCDASDPVQTDPLVDWVRLPEPRYAAFDGSGPAISEGTPREEPLMINDVGDILYHSHIWRAGTLQPLERGNLTSGQGIRDCRALGMNNQGVIIGVGIGCVERVPDSGQVGGLVQEEVILVCWPDPHPGTLPLRVEATAGTDTLTAHCLNEWFGTAIPAEFPHDSLIDDQGRFFATTMHKEADIPDIHACWGYGASGFAQVAQSDPAATPDPAPPWACFTIAPEVIWGSLGGGTPVRISGVDQTLAFEVLRFAKRPGDRITAIPKKGAPHRKMEGAGNEWVASNTLTSCTDLSGNGVVVSTPATLWVNPHSRNSLDKSPFILGKRSFQRVAPEIGEPWKSRPGMADASPKGWILAYQWQPPDVPVISLAVMPLIVADDGFAKGVDDTSLKIWGENADPSAGDRFWIMVPAGNADPNVTRFQTPAGGEVQVTIEPPADVAPVSTLLDTPDKPVNWSSTRTETADLDLAIRLDSTTSSSQPVGLKIMKRRKVNIRVWHVTLPGGGGVMVPMARFTENEIKEHLDKIFLPQVNIDWNVQVEGYWAPDQMDWDIGARAGTSDPQIDDTARNGLFDVVDFGDDDPEGPGEEELKVKEQHYDTMASINIYLIGGGSYGFPVYHRGPDGTSLVRSIGYSGDPAVAGGISDPRSNMRTVWISASIKLDKPEWRQEMLDTIGHEIGHVMIGAGHPDNGKGPAPLPGTDRSQRLMNSGTSGNPDNWLLVKGEWDKIEEFLKGEEIGGRQP